MCPVHEGLKEIQQTVQGRDTSLKWNRMSFDLVDRVAVCIDQGNVHLGGADVNGERKVWFVLFHRWSSEMSG
jgi:hypothetical protein